MNGSQMATPTLRRQNDATLLEDADAVETVLGALEDPDCRSILEATGDSALTASEVAEACDLPTSTTYRKLDILTEASLVEERVRIRRSGKHASEYVRAVDDVVVTMGPEGVSVRLSNASQSEESGDIATFSALAD
ncbi:winged helix-turn-helix domain-containing protein [Haloglomus salinum]|jgi:DNA-binding transcriptional ArsR family regulator|uniref:winged helix-turn-helix domain-containing protein n=1 Tax=Haloglomus salinum TaxID=2962673 RepID=UPI0020C9FD33|nr:helix-turn-helix domain-containing protein [Haloglomus salinum]